MGWMAHPLGWDPWHTCISRLPPPVEERDCTLASTFVGKALTPAILAILETEAGSSPVTIPLSTHSLTSTSCDSLPR
jgi:hypothetical protein